MGKNGRKMDGNNYVIMKIGIDARMYGSEQAGLGRYVEQLIKYLQKIDHENEYVIFLHKKNHKSLELIPPQPRLGGALLAVKADNLKLVLSNIKWYSWSEQLLFPWIIKKEKIDLMHFPHWNVPLLYNDPFVVTVHDLIMYHYPRQEASTHGPLVYWLKDKLHRLVLKHANKKARQIIAPSKFTKNDIHKTLGVSLNKISTVYLAPLTPLTSNPHPVTRNENFNLKNLPITKPYILYVGNAYPHKNLDTLIKAWKVFSEKYDNNFQLVLVGKKNYFYQKLLNTEVNRLEAGSRCGGTLKHLNNLIFTDYVNDEQLIQLYTKAKLYIFPSLYEGFGLPPLEAMTYGIPVVSSNVSCLPEILGDAALYFDPKNVDEIVRAIHLGLHDESIRGRLGNEAKKLLGGYSWEKTARETLGIYNNIKI